MPLNSNRKWVYEASKFKKDKFEKDIKTEPIGTVLKNYFIKSKDRIQSNGFKANDISCIGNKKDIAQKLITVMDDEKLKFDELPDITQKLIIKLHTFIQDNNKE